jgi:uncharacterized protein involved in type VI secretion and phage assembly
MSAARPEGSGPLLFGVYPALVTDIVDPRKLGRIELKFPWLGDDGDAVRAWATLLTPYADNDQGFEFLPAVGTQVVVAFEAGNLRRPYILGSCWNGQQALPEEPSKPNDKRVIRTRAGSKLEFDDNEAASKVTLSMSNGHKLVLDDGGHEVTLTHANGCVITFNAGGQIEINANTAVEINAPLMNVHAATATFDGIVNCTTINCSVGVASPSYTPGVGNIW